jgi:hypothetical protein
LENSLLSYRHQSLVTRLCDNLALPLSEYNFANLYLFKKIHQYRLIEVMPSRYCIKGVSYDKKSFFMPLFHPSDWGSYIKIAKDHHIDYLFPIPELWTPELEAKGYSLEISESDSDYLYDAESIRMYRGRHLDGQRNLVRNLLSEHSVNINEISAETLPEAYKVIDAWEQENRSMNTLSDVEACREGALEASQLGLQGWIYKVDETPTGLLIGGPLTSHIYMYHFSKASLGYRGLSALMHQDIASRIDRKYTILNWEQDLGIEGLRHAKRSYHPQSLAGKGKLWTKDPS